MKNWINPLCHLFLSFYDLNCKLILIKEIHWTNLHAYFYPLFSSFLTQLTSVLIESRPIWWHVCSGVGCIYIEGCLESINRYKWAPWLKKVWFIQYQCAILNKQMFLVSSRSSLPSLTLSRVLSSSPSTVQCDERWEQFPPSARQQWGPRHVEFIHY